LGLYGFLVCFSKNLDDGERHKQTGRVLEESHKNGQNGDHLEEPASEEHCQPESGTSGNIYLGISLLDE
jgi:hypothetical protein